MIAQLILDNLKSIVGVLALIIGWLVGFVISWRTLKTKVKSLETWKTNFLKDVAEREDFIGTKLDDKDKAIANLREKVNGLELDNKYNKEYTKSKLDDINTNIAEVNRSLRNGA